uniref:C2 domain-containing protein n=1 Tax=Guillardia theta TaxID=55529 RepID=A0A7S4L0E3_GUITH|mmetsp:Transcript_34442/g.108027  ORF Transcript_34442/g.108027 Transcript_34442/m.108027 type:complete len:422 (+) Transcript_34442:125-1390(+)
MEGKFSGTFRGGGTISDSPFAPVLAVASIQDRGSDARWNRNSFQAFGMDRHNNARRESIDQLMDARLERAKLLATKKDKLSKLLQNKFLAETTSLVKSGFDNLANTARDFSNDVVTAVADSFKEQEKTEEVVETFISCEHNTDSIRAGNLATEAQKEAKRAMRASRRAQDVARQIHVTPKDFRRFSKENIDLSGLSMRPENQKQAILSVTIHGGRHFPLQSHTQESSENSGRYVSSYVQVNLLRGSEPTFQAFSTCVCNNKKHPSWQETFKFYFMQSESELMLDHVFEFLLLKDTPQNILDQDNSVETNRLIGKFKVPFKSFIQFFPRVRHPAGEVDEEYHEGQISRWFNIDTSYYLSKTPQVFVTCSLFDPNAPKKLSKKAKATMAQLLPASEDYSIPKERPPPEWKGHPQHFLLYGDLD